MSIQEEAVAASCEFVLDCAASGPTADDEAPGSPAGELVGMGAASEAGAGLAEERGPELKLGRGAGAGSPPGMAGMLTPATPAQTRDFSIKKAVTIGNTV